MQLLILDDVVVVETKRLLRLPESALATARDKATVQHTAFNSFLALAAAKGSYRPSLYMTGRGPATGQGRKTPKAMRELLFLTIQYNDHQHAHGCPKRVCKGDWQILHPGRFPRHWSDEGYGLVRRRLREAGTNWRPSVPSVSSVLSLRSPLSTVNSRLSIASPCSP